MNTIMEIKKLEKSFGGLSAVLDFNFHLEQNELVGLIGPNGAGKTTIFNLITGVYKPDKGNIIFNGQKIEGMAPHSICARGIARTFQNIRLFNDLTVLDNVKIAAHKNVPYGFVSAVFRTPGFFKGEELIEEEALKYLKIFKLDDKRNELARICPMANNADWK